MPEQMALFGQFWAVRRHLRLQVSTRKVWYADIVGEPCVQRMEQTDDSRSRGPSVTIVGCGQNLKTFTLLGPGDIPCSLARWVKCLTSFWKRMHFLGDNLRNIVQVDKRVDMGWPTRTYSIKHSNVAASLQSLNRTALLYYPTNVPSTHP